LQDNPEPRGALTWRSAGEAPNASATTLLVAPTGEPLLVLDFHCYVTPLAPPRFLVWHSEGTLGDGDYSASAAVRFRVFDADALTPITDLTATLSEMPAEKNGVGFSGGEVASVAVPTSLRDGQNRVDFPPEMHTLDEILVLANSTADLAAGNYWQEEHLRIWIVRPRDGNVEVIPQDWFNHGSYDFAYQGVTRIARDPSSGRIVGEGFRLDAFVLDKSNRRVAKWLRTNPFSSDGTGH